MKKIVIAQDLQPLMMRILDFLHRSDIEVVAAATNETILKYHIENNANLIISNPGLPGLAMETLVHIIRRSEAMRKVSILLVCENLPGHRERAIRCSVNAVMTNPVDPVRLAEKVQLLLDVPPRRAYRVSLNVDVDSNHRRRSILCHSENISIGGMLIKTSENLDCGDRIECSFYLPDGHRIKTTGDIARSLKQPASAISNLYGIRFQSLPQDSRSAIAAFVEQEMHRQSSSGGSSPTLVA